MMVSGTTATTLNVDGNDIDVKVEYADDEYDTIDKLQGIVPSDSDRRIRSPYGYRGYRLQGQPAEYHKE